jgi:nucleoside-diphosphate-sugar epimerase
MKKYLLIGGLGFVGKKLAGYLAGKGHAITIMDIRDLTELEEISCTENRINYIKGSATKDRDLDLVFEEHFEGVFHLASFVGIKNYISDPIGVITTTIDGTKKVAEKCIQHNTHLLFTSTSEVLGKNPNIPWKEDADRVYGSTTRERWSYGSSKGVAEQLIIGLGKSKGLSYTVTRFFNIYGEDQNPIFIIPKSIHNCLNGISPLLYDSGNQTRSFTYIDDALLALDSLISNKSNGIFHIGSNYEHSIKDVINTIITLTNTKLSVQSVDTDHLYGKTYEDISRRVPDVSKIFQEVGWKATTPLEEGLIKTIEWVKLHPWWLKKDSSISIQE